MSILKRFVSAIAGSKKAVATVAGALFTLLAPVARRYGVEITEEQVLEVLGLIGAYVIGQGVADHGKEAAKIAAPAIAAASTKGVTSGEVES